jgi:hypothetical protein
MHPDKPSWKRLALHGGTCAVLVCLYLVSPQIGGGYWCPELVDPHVAFLAASIPVGVAVGALAALQVLTLGGRWPPWVYWPAAACLGGSIYGLFVLMALNSLALAILCGSIWTFGWLFFCWRRTS